jgi:hypothetical protein
MPTHIRAQISVAVGDLLPRNRMVVTPCFRHSTEAGLLSGPDYTALATDLANGWNTWSQSIGETTVKLYELGPLPPNDPKATVTLNAGMVAAYSYPREIALCLSFSGGPSRPTNRGRLYIPAGFLGGSTPALRPASTVRDKVAALVPIFAGLGGVNVDWIVWSQKLKQATKVERWFVDDEWDIQRRRGGKPTTRTAGTTSG